MINKVILESKVFFGTATPEVASKNELQLISLCLLSRFCGKYLIKKQTKKNFQEIIDNEVQCTKFACFCSKHFQDGTYARVIYSLL